MIDEMVEELLEAAPDFGPRYLRLVREADGDPGLAAALTELAEFVAELARRVDDPLRALQRCLDAVEGLARRSEDGAELVAWAFVDSLHPEERRGLSPRLGPRTLALLAEVEGFDGAPGGTTAEAGRSAQDRAESTAARKGSGASSIG